MNERGRTYSSTLHRLAALAADPVRALSLIEQAVLSGANFAALLLLARGLSEPEFGLFSFAWLSLLFMVNLHRSAVVVPFVIHAASREVLAAEAPLWRRLNRLTAGLTAALLAVAALVVALTGTPRWMAEALLMAALLVPPAFAYEFRRRWLIQLDRYGAAVAAAVLYLVLWLAGVLAALAAHSLTVAVAALVAANLGAAVLCTALAASASPAAGAGKSPAFLPFVARLAHFIAWSVMSNLAYNGYGHLPPLILGALAGPVPVAIFQAMRNFAQPLATLGTAIDNFDKPRAVRAMAEGGAAGLRRSLTHTTLAMAALSAPYMLVLAVLGETLVALFYGNRYGGSSHVLLWFVAAQTAVIAAYPLETALFVVRRPDLLFRGRLIAAAAGIGLSLALVPTWGIAGAMAAMIGGLVLSGIAAALQLPQVRR